MNVSFALTFATSYTWESVEAEVQEAIQEYFAELAKEWPTRKSCRPGVSQIETKVLAVDGIIDVTGTTINGTTQNISLASNAIPVLGVVENVT